MTENYYFVSGANVMLPVKSVTEEPDEETIIAARVSTIDIDRKEEQQQEETNSSSSAVTSSNTVEIKMDTGEGNKTKKENETAEVKKIEKPENAEVAVEKEKEDEYIEEDAYVAFGPGGDPGRDKALGELADEEEVMPTKPWFRDDCYDSEDSYFDEDYFDDFDDCF